jgi:uncharacterized protein YndB with AHSA1/START domain
MSELTVTRTLHIAAHPSAVWAALTEAELISEWFGNSTTIDLRVGGTGVLTWDDWGSYGFVVEELDEPNTFAYRWVRKPDTDPLTEPTTHVRFTLTPKDGGTELTVVETGWEQFGAEADGMMRENTEGWLEELDELQAFLEKQDSV